MCVCTMQTEFGGFTHTHTHTLPLQKWPKVAKGCQNVSITKMRKVAKTWQKLTKVAKSYHNMVKVGKRCEKFLKVAKI